ncbi:MAG TPA: hypothetical protein VMM37_08930, partial [Bacteroidota bacterium]|nr:hypothetical protein [Bacteroidota bacterium]
MKTIALAVLTLCVSFGMYSEAVASDTLTFRYPSDVVVSAPRISLPLQKVPFSTSLVTSDVSGSMPRSVAIDEPLKLVPGVKVDNQANGSRVHLSIRGQGILSERGI